LVLSNPNSQSVKKIFAVALLLAATLLAYAPALQDQFVWDDTALVLRDPLIRSWRLIPEGFNHFLFVDATASDFYRPMQRLVYTALYCGFAFAPAAYHAANIICHAIAAIALFLFGEELLLAFGVETRARRYVALAASLIWAVHPVHSSAVAYVSGLADPLAAMFGFAACYLLLRAWRSQASRGLVWIAGAGICFLASVLSKEIGFAFVLAGMVPLALQKKWRTTLQAAVALLFVFAIYFSLRHGAEHHPAPPPRMVEAWTVRPITMARAVAEYAGLLVFPINLQMDRELHVFVSGPGDHKIDAAAWRELQTTAGLLVLALTLWWLVRSRGRSPATFVLLLLAAITYLPVSGVLVLNASVAEHWIYLPSAFVILAATLTVVEFARRKAPARLVASAATITAIAWCLFLGIRTFIRTFDWKDQRTFLERNIASGGDSARMLINLGGLELSQGHIELAKRYLEAAMKKEPDQPLATINLAAVALKENDWKKARELLMRAKDMPVVDARAEELLAVLENKEHGNADLLRLRLASRTGAPDWSIESRYIRLLDEAGATTKAIDETRHCLATEWYRADTWLLLSDLLTKSGDIHHAADALAVAHDYDVHLGRGGAPP
jgi:tetratricopeptide (TPR) repeat protein